jgi:hypothetical protein
MIQESGCRVCWHCSTNDSDSFVFSYVKKTMTECNVRLEMVGVPKMYRLTLSSLQILYNLSDLRQTSITVNPNSTYNCLNRRSKRRFRLLTCLTWVLFEPSCQVPPFSYLLQLIVRCDLLNRLVTIFF